MLEIGCSVGGPAVELVKCGAVAATGIDFYDGMVRVALAPAAESEVFRLHLIQSGGRSKGRAS